MRFNLIIIQSILFSLYFNNAYAKSMADSPVVAIQRQDIECVMITTNKERFSNGPGGLLAGTFDPKTGKIKMTPEEKKRYLNETHVVTTYTAQFGISNQAVANKIESVTKPQAFGAPASYAAFYFGKSGSFNIKILSENAAVVAKRDAKILSIARLTDSVGAHFQVTLSEEKAMQLKQVIIKNNYKVCKSI